MKKTIKRLLSLIGIHPRAYIQHCYEYDANRYAAQSGLMGESPSVIAAKMRIICHTIEKALSLKDCRADFGKEKILDLIRLYDIYKDSNYEDRNVLSLVESTLSVYVKHRNEHGLNVSFIPNLFLKGTTVIECGAQTFDSTVRDFKDFPYIAHARHSIRNYSNRFVTKEDIERAVSIAQTAPSACNRQATRIYAITDSHKISLLKQRHGGIRTFGQPGVVFVISQDMNLYINEYERNTWLVDGGIFCMNLLYSLNSVGIVNCPVIWGGMEDEDRFISELVGIPENERVVVLVVGGYAPEEGVKTPISPKRPISDILRIVNQ